MQMEDKKIQKAADHLGVKSEKNNKAFWKWIRKKRKKKKGTQPSVLGPGFKWAGSFLPQTKGR